MGQMLLEIYICYTVIIPKSVIHLDDGFSLTSSLHTKSNEQFLRIYVRLLHLILVKEFTFKAHKYTSRLMLVIHFIDAYLYTYTHTGARDHAHVENCLLFFPFRIPEGTIMYILGNVCVPDRNTATISTLRHCQRLFRWI